MNWQLIVGIILIIVGIYMAYQYHMARKDLKKYMGGGDQNV